MIHKISFSKTGAFALLISMFVMGCADMELQKSDALRTDAGNIAGSSQPALLCALPDASVGSVQFASITGNTFSYTFKVTNIGGAALPIGDMFFQAYVSKDTTYDLSDKAAGGAIFFGGPTSLATGESYTQNWYYNPTVPEDINVYKYVLIKVAARTGTLAECRTDNNTKAQRIAFDIPRNGLVAFYPFSGNANDASGHGLHGTPMNGPALATDRFGIANNTYLFDGANDYINVGNPALLQISNTITVSGWYNVRAFTAGHSPGHDAKSIITKIYFDPLVGGNPRRGYTLNQNYFGGGKPSAATAIYSSDNLGNVTSFLSSYVGGDISENEWIFFCFVIDGTSYKYYHNAVLTNTFNTSSTIITDGSLGDLHIGAYGSGFTFNGRLDDIAIYNRVLTDAEITQLYRQTISK